VAGGCARREEAVLFENLPDHNLPREVETKADFLFESLVTR
jgi:hypothetical protein